ncbi:MAG TPA: BadF/BadG/BcrA/BcrD ATPase family protein [Solirubrobacteraceae bacterium]|nr:BadF/BadG/BcrA/BcrD ATPase family protein [Solirubrobacteraceae bacterium]
MNRKPLVELPAALAVPESGAPRAATGGDAGTGKGGASTDAGAASGAGARYVLGIDGGATKTLAAVLDLDRRTLHLGHAGPSNEDAVGPRLAVKAVLDAADEALAAAGIAQQDLAAAVLAIAGTDTDSVARNLRTARPEDWIVVGDVVGAWATATGAQPGVGVISGTGSNVFGVGGTGAATKTWRAGGWGHLLGDEGSGYWIGAQSIVAALHDRDGSGPETALSDAALAFFGSPSLEALAASVYTTPLTKSEVAAFAIETSRLADQGDGVARELYARGADLLAKQVQAVIDRTGLQGEFPVGLIGSAFRAGAVFVGPLTAAIHDVAPGAHVFPVDMTPVGGPLLLAARACGREGELEDRELARLIESALDRIATTASGT